MPKIYLLPIMYFGIFTTQKKKERKEENGKLSQMGFTVFHQSSATEWLTRYYHVLDLISCLFFKLHQNLLTSAAFISLPTVINGESHLQNTVDFSNHSFHSIKIYFFFSNKYRKERGKSCLSLLTIHNDEN